MTNTICKFPKYPDTQIAYQKLMQTMQYFDICGATPPAE